MRRSISTVSLTMDFWTNPDELPIMGMTIHCIDDSWSLHECVLGVDELMGSHTGQNMADVFIRVLRD